MTLIHSHLASPVGRIQLVASEVALVGIYLEAQVARGQPPESRPGTSAVLTAASDQLTAYFAGALTAFSIPLAPTGTPFQQRVWETLRTIPFGVRWSYAQLADAVGSPAAARAVGAANGKNPLSIVVPCHRVVGANGALTGYAGGVDAKAWLLAHEAAAR